MHEVKSIQDLPSQINRDEILLPEFQNGYVCEVVGRSAPENILGAAEAKAQNGLAGALEEEVRLTALLLCTLQAITSDDAGQR